jgi:hypothetical protein
MYIIISYTYANSIQIPSPHPHNRTATPLQHHSNNIATPTPIAYGHVLQHHCIAHSNTHTHHNTITTALQNITYRENILNSREHILNAHNNTHTHHNTITTALQNISISPAPPPGNRNLALIPAEQARAGPKEGWCYVAITGGRC